MTFKVKSLSGLLICEGIKGGLENDSPIFCGERCTNNKTAVIGVRRSAVSATDVARKGNGLPYQKEGHNYEKDLRMKSS